MANNGNMNPAILHRHDPRGTTFGWGISLLVHALAVAWLWQAWPGHRDDPHTGPVRRIEVRLVPVVPSVAPRLPPPLAAPVPSAAPRSTPQRRPPPAARARAAPTATIAEPAPADAASGTQGGADHDGPTVDLQAARAEARRIAREADQGLVALPKPRPRLAADPGDQVQDRLEHARRADCKTMNADSIDILGNAVNLARNLVANAVDGNGCKW